jgi:hypothetical protein
LEREKAELENKLEKLQALHAKTKQDLEDTMKQLEDL